MFICSLFAGNRDELQSLEVQYTLYGFNFDPPLIVFGSANVFPSENGDNIRIRIFHLQFYDNPPSSIPAGVVHGTGINWCCLRESSDNYMLTPYAGVVAA